MNDREQNPTPILQHRYPLKSIVFLVLCLVAAPLFARSSYPPILKDARVETYRKIDSTESLENEPITAPKKRGRPKLKRSSVEDEIVPLGDVRCKQRLGGLLKSYSSAA